MTSSIHTPPFKHGLESQSGTGAAVVVGAVVEVDAVVVEAVVVGVVMVVAAVVDAVVVEEVVVEADAVGCIPLPLPLIESSSVVAGVATVVVDDPIRLSQNTPVYPGSQTQ